ncbi:MAG: hypothetical protein LUG61_08665 [Lachnospiraceae bacterium]|nr:hypothetical protein [Lachnospiraceae bacterium]
MNRHHKKNKVKKEEVTSEYDKERLQDRLAKLAGGVAVIRVGAATETEMKEAKLRMEDVLAATSVTSTLLTTEAAVGEIKEPAAAAPAGTGADMDY